MLHKPYVRFLFVIVGIAALMTMFQFPGLAEDTGGFTTSVTMERAEYGAADAIMLRFALTNDSDKSVNVLKWRTPLEGFNSDMFEVEIEGKRVTYTGRLVKRGAPRAGDYVSIAPGESVEAVVDIGTAYAIYQAGDYGVRFKSSLYDFGHEAPAELAAKKTFKQQEMQSGTVTFKLLESKEAPELPKLSDLESKAMQPVFKNCTQTRKDALDSALSEAETVAAAALLVLNSTDVGKRSGAKRYTTWFGSYTASRYDTVIAHFEKIHDALANKTITFNCDCNEDYFAYVYPNKPYEIFLCNAFWSAPLSGTDSKVGTIIHELSHFYVVAGTQDHAYGHVNCQNLANTNPSLAVGNADSHEYFAENNPPLPMGLEIAVYSLILVLLLILAYRAIYKRGPKAVTPGGTH